MTTAPLTPAPAPAHVVPPTVAPAAPTTAQPATPAAQPTALAAAPAAVHGPERAPSEKTERAAEARRPTQYDDVYITRFAGELHLIRVNERPELSTGTFFSIPETQYPDWTAGALLEALKMTRSRSTVRVHTTEKEIVEGVRKHREKDGADWDAVRRELGSRGKALVVSLPHRELPAWRKVMELLKDGKLPYLQPGVTYMVHTASFTTGERVYSGAVMLGLGNIILYSTSVPGDDLVSAELDLMRWIIQNSGGGGRVQVHHASDEAMRIWEQADHLAQIEAVDSREDEIARNGSKLRTLLRECAHQRTSVQPALKPHPVFAQLARDTSARQYVRGDGPA